MLCEGPGRSGPWWLCIREQGWPEETERAGAPPRQRQVTWGSAAPLCCALWGLEKTLVLSASGLGTRASTVPPGRLLPPARLQPHRAAGPRPLLGYGAGRGYKPSSPSHLPWPRPGRCVSQKPGSSWASSARNSRPVHRSTDQSLQSRVSLAQSFLLLSCHGPLFHSLSLTHHHLSGISGEDTCALVRFNKMSPD